MPAPQELTATDAHRPASVNFKSCRPFLIMWAIYLLLVGFGLKFAFFPSGLAERMDFRQLYTGAILARTAPSQLYNWENQKEVQDAVVSKAVGLLPYNHPPYEAVFLRPLSWLPYRRAFLATALLNVALLGACFFLCRDEFSHTGAFAQPRPGFQIFAFFPTTVAIFHGQDSVILLFCCCLAFYFAKREQRFLSGAMIALAIFKPQIACPVAGILAASYGISFVGGFASGIFLISLCSLAVVGREGLISSARVILQTGSVGTSLQIGTMGVFPYAMPNLRGLTWLMTWPFHNGRISLILTIMFSVITLVWNTRMILARRPTAALSFSIAIMCAVLVSFHLQLADLVVLLIPLGVMSASQSRPITIARASLFIAPPFLTMLGVNFLCLLASVVLLLAHGMMALE